MRLTRQSDPFHVRRTRFLWLTTLGALAGIAGCRSAPVSRPNSADSPATTSAEAAVPSLPLTPVECRLAEPGRALFRSRLSEAGGKPGEDERYLAIERLPDPGGDPTHPAWIVRRSEGPTPGGPWTLTVEQHFVTTDRGDAAIASETNHTEDAELTFTPPMIVMPASLPAGGSEFTQSIRLRVSPIDKPSQIRARGPVRVTIRHEGGDTVASDTGRLPAQRVVRVFSGALAPAEVVNTTRQWFVPGHGLVAEDREEHTRVFGVPTRNNRESWVVVSPAPPR